ncbi:MAG TPA: hypothetical protein VLK33_04040 [Terriglobales bacterium]|nr:hypothetical protein [Terriglobales bacterium]
MFNEIIKPILAIAVVSFSATVALLFSQPSEGLNTCGEPIQEWEKLTYLAPSAHDYRPYLNLLGFDNRGNIMVELAQTDGNNSASKFFKSEDHGQRWIQIDKLSSMTSTVNGPSIASPQRSAILYKKESGEYLRSIDGGKHWESPRMLVNGKPAIDFVTAKAGIKDFDGKVSVVWAGIHPKNPLVIFASFTYSNRNSRGTPSVTVPIEGLFVSRDGGDNWSLLTTEISASKNTLIPLYPVIGISSSNPKLMMGYSDFGLVRTTDSGNTWIPVGQRDVLESPAEIEGMSRAVNEFEKQTGRKSAAPNASMGWRRLFVSQIEFSPTNSMVIYLSTNKGLFYTNDGGESWFRLRVGERRLGEILSIAINPNEPSEILAGMSTSIYRSTDGGCHFSKMESIGSVSEAVR